MSKAKNNLPKKSFRTLVIFIIAMCYLIPIRTFAVDSNDDTVENGNSQLIEMEDPNTLDNQDEIKQEYEEIVTDMITDNNSEPMFSVTTDKASSNDSEYYEQTENTDTQTPKETLSDSDPHQESDKVNDSDAENPSEDDNASLAEKDEVKQPTDEDEDSKIISEIKQEAINRGQKLVAVIDTGSAGQFAEAQVNFTDEIDVDEMGHGSFMSKIIKDNADDKAYILSLKAFTKDGKGTVVNVMKALQFAIDQHVDVINMSFTTNRDNSDLDKLAFEEKVKEAEEKGITVIAAAGNNNSDAAKYIPASIDGVTTIGAMNKKQYKIESSNYGDVVDFYEIASSTSEACAKYTGKYVSGRDMSGEVTKDTIKIDFTGAEDTPDDKGFTTTGVTVVFEGVATVNLTYASWNGYTITPGQDYTLKAPIPSGYKNSTYNCGGVSISSGGTNINGKTFSTSESQSSAITRHVACTFAGGTPNSSTYFLNVNLNDPNGNEKTDGSLGTFSYTYSNWGESGKLNVSDCYETGQYQGRLFRVGQLKLKPGLVGKDAYCLTASGTTGVNVMDDGFVMAINGNTTVNINTRWAVLYVNPNGGSWNSSTSTSSVTCSATNQSKNIGNPSRTGYTFKGWSFSGKGSWNGSTYTYGNGDGTLTASWSVNSYYLDLNGNLDGTDNGGLGNYGTADIYINNTKVASGVTDYYTQHPYGSTYKIVVTPKTGHSVNQTTWTGTIGVGGVSVRPKLTTNKYTITYKANGGSGDDQTQTATYGTSWSTKGAVFTRTGYTQTSWNTAANGSGTKYSLSTAQTASQLSNVTLYAQWTANDYSVSINPNGGTYNGTTGLTTKTGKYGSNLEVTEIPTRSGYTFVGWKRSGGGSLHSGVAKSKTSQITMAEKADSDGTAYTNYKMNYQNTGTGNAYPNMNFFTYSYTQGHTYRLDFDVRVNSVSGLGYSNMRNSAFGNNWEAPSVSINAKTSGWQHKSVSRTLTGTTITQSSTEHTIAPIVEWYCSVPAGNTGVFDFDLKNISIYDVTAGTYVASTSADVKNSSYVTMTDSNSTLTAVWSLNTYSISYNVNGGNALSGQQTSYNVTSAEYTLPTPTRTGYTFTGWTGSNGSTPQTTVKIPTGSTGNKSYTANWSVNKYTYNIKYVSKSGVSLGTATIAGNYGTSATATPPAKTGYTAPANQTVSFDSTTAKTITFTYTPIAYTISYDVNGGDALSGQRTSYNIESDAYTLPTPTRKGYTFTGWTGSNGTTAQKTVTLAKGNTGNKSYKANWSANSYTVIYNANNGTGSMSNDTVTYGTAYKTKMNAYSRPGYTFAGWNTKADGSGTAWSLTEAGTYESGKAWTWTYTTGITLYAQWKQNTYAIGYNVNGGNTLSGQRTSYNSDSAAYTLPTPTRTGYTFTGWTESISTTNWTSGFINLSSGAIETFSTYPNSVFSERIFLKSGVTYTISGTNLGGIRWRAFKADGTYIGSVSQETSYTPTQDMYVNILLYEGATAENRNAMKITSSNAKTIDKGATGTRNYTANWSAKNYTLTLNPNGGNWSGSTAAKALSPNLIYNQGNWNNLNGQKPARTGYTFTGWFTASSGGVKVYNADGTCVNEGTYWKNGSGYVHDGNLTVYAQWTANTYTIAYNGNTATSGSTSSTSHTYDTAKNLASNGFRKDGYTFKNWNTKSDGSGTSYSNGASIKNLATSGTVTLYAQWTAKSASITYSAGDNGKVDKTSETVTGTNNATGSTATANAGYHLDGWYGDNPSKKITGSAKLTLGNPNAQNGFGSTGYYGGKVTYDSTTKTYSVTASASSMNASWGSGAAFLRSDEIPYEKWYIVTMEVYSPIAATLKLDNNDYACTGSSWSGNDNDTNRNVYGFGAIKANTWTKVMFAYQNIHSGNTNSAAIYDCSGIGLIYDTSLGDQTFKIRNVQGMIADSFTGSASSYTAKFAANTYTVKYDGNGATGGSTASSTHTYDSSKALTANGFSRTGYTFDGWNTQADGKGTTYANNASIKNLTTTNNGTVTLYAQWTLNTYSISYTLNGGSISGQPTSYNVNTATFTLPKPTKTGYTFTGWTGSNGTTAQTSVSIAKGSTGNKSYTANWKVNSYTITYNANDGTGADQTQTVTYGTAWTSKGATFTKTGYTQTSWNTNADGTGITYSLNKQQTDKQLSNVILYARYTPHTLKINYHNDGASQWQENPGNTKIDVTNKDIVQTETVKYDATYDHAANGLLDAVRFTKTGYSVAAYWKVGSKTSTTRVSYADNSLANYGTNGQGVAKFLGALTELEKGNTTVDLYPDFVPNSYTIKYNGNGNTGGSTANSSHTYDTAKALTANGFTKTGYSFTGWNTQADGKGTTYADKASVKNLSSTNGATINLYAQWKANTLTVIYYPNGATKADNSSNVDGSDVITIDPNSSNLTDTFKYDQTLPSYGLWDSQRYIRIGYSSKNKYHVGSKDGATLLDAGPNAYAKTQDLAKAAGKLTDLEKGNITISIYADWTPIGYTITYNLDGGSISGQKTSYNIETATFALPTPSKTGYTFAGWTGSNGSTPQTSVSISKGSTGNKTYTAKWTAKTYSVTYNANGGTGTMSGDTVTFNTAYKTKQNAFKREGFIFNGWNEKADGTGTKWDITSGSSGTYESGKAWTWAYASNITLYAQWVPESYNWTVPTTINFDGSSTTKFGTISVTDNTLAAGRTLKIKVADDASFKLKDKSNADNTCDYTVMKGSETLKAGSTILSLPTDTKSANQAISININKTQIAGTYEDVLEFTASVE